MNRKEFQKFIIKERKQSTLSLRAYADELGVSWMTVWRWEQGRNCPGPDAMEYWIERVLEIA